jgi:hypothetical protein
MALSLRAGAASARAEDFADSIPDGPRDFREIDCVRHLLADDTLAAVERRAAALGVGTDRVLISSGALSEEIYLSAFGKALGVAFEPLDEAARAQCPLGSDRLIEAAAAGLLPLTIDDDLYLVVAPRGVASRQIMMPASTPPNMPDNSMCSCRG